MVEIYGYSIITIGIISAAVYAIIECLKLLWLNDREDLKKYIPIIAAAIGGVLGIATYFVRPDVLPSPTWYGAIITGLASGLSAVGINQIPKQLGPDT